MTEKCSVYACRRASYMAGYCEADYERDISPYKHLARGQLRGFIEAVQEILWRNLGLSLPSALIPMEGETVSKPELQLRYREVKRHLDLHLRKTAIRAPQLGPYCRLLGSGIELWQKWEKLTFALARVQFGEIYVRPRLANNRVPDIVPRMDGIRLASSRRDPAVEWAPMIIEVKQGLLHPSVWPKYGAYAGIVEVWFYRWKPGWLERLEKEVIYLSPVELATRAAERGASSLATALRTLPILWRNYELLPHYSQGLPPRASS